MGIQVIINQMSVILILLAAGFCLGKLKILTPEGSRIITRVVLSAGLPCTILNSVFSGKPDVEIADTLFYLLVCFLSYAAAFAIAVPAVRLSRASKENRGLLTYMSVFSNCAFMGFPVVMAVFGAAGGFYAAIYNIPFNLLSFSVGIYLVAGKGSRFNPKLLLNPPLVASVLAIPLALVSITPHIIVTETLRIAGGLTTPGALIVIGSSLAYYPIRNIIGEWRVGIIAMLKLVIVPLAVWFIFRPFITDELMLGVLVVLSAMPAAAQSAMLAIQYDGNDKIASAGISVTTLLCIVTIPLIVYFLIM